MIEWGRDSCIATPFQFQLLFMSFPFFPAVSFHQTDEVSHPTGAFTAWATQSPRIQVLAEPSVAVRQHDDLVARREHDVGARGDHVVRAQDAEDDRAFSGEPAPARRDRRAADGAVLPKHADEETLIVGQLHWNARTKQREQVDLAEALDADGMLLAQDPQRDLEVLRVVRR